MSKIDSKGDWKFERSSGFGGYRCQKCQTWKVQDLTDGVTCECDELPDVISMDNLTPSQKATPMFSLDDLFNIGYNFYKDGDSDRRNDNACIGSFKSHFQKMLESPYRKQEIEKHIKNNTGYIENFN